jgi:type IV pilus assembly protein PilC
MARVAGIPKKQKLINYRYQAYTRQGKLVKGTIKAASDIAAERLIIGKGLNPTQVGVAPSMFSLEEAFPTFFKVKSRDVTVFSRQLAILLRSGISLLPAIEILQGQVAASRAFKRILESITYDLRAGVSFSQALSKHPKAFSDIYYKTITVGEQTGSLETVLLRMADFQERQSTMAQKIRKALAYPMMVMGVGVGVVVLLIVVVMPNLIGMFTAMNVELPLPTRILIGITNFVNANTLYLLIGGVVLVAVVLTLVKQPRGRQLLDRLRLTAPILGPPALMSELGRFSRTVSVLISSGLSLQEIMGMIPHSTDNRFFRDALNRVNERLFLGEGLSGPMSSIAIFPPLLVQMVAVGEESNTLDYTMGVVADFYETSAEEKATTMVGLITPISTIGIALLVGFIALAVIMPMYTLTGAVGG